MELFTTPGELATARQVLGLDPGADRAVVEAAVILAFGLADELIRDTDDVLASELEYLTVAVELGWGLDG